MRPIADLIIELGSHPNMLKYYDMRFEDTLTKNKTEVLEIATEIFEIAENHGLNNWIYPPAGKALPENICRYLTK